MNFRRSAASEEPEINLIPMIDVLLVILIFLMITTTYSRFSGMEINLPTADAQNLEHTDKNEIQVAIAANGQMRIERTAVTGQTVNDIIAILNETKQSKNPNPVVVINADAHTEHQKVINVMQAAQGANLSQISFATQQEPTP